MMSVKSSQPKKILFEISVDALSISIERFLCYQISVEPLMFFLLLCKTVTITIASSLDPIIIVM